ncbi:MAG: PIN domain-containing protein [Planctomycetota bacterium]|jgi:predicted nucleic acid-binding protein|nr:PIN domain-containing protein [Planctomycetota bacterium]
MFLDTSGLLSLYDARDAFHANAVQLYRGAHRLITHNYVLAELAALANARNLPREGALRYIADLLDHPVIETLWVDEPLHRAALTLLSRRLDKTYSLCDAVSFLQMEERRIREALTTDRHFEQEGFTRLLKQ